MIETLYVHRKLLNPKNLIDWAKRQGFRQTLAPDDMHVTIAFSKKRMSWGGLHPLKNKIKVTGGPRPICPLGDKGAIVLRFENQNLHNRWQEILDHGGSWDYGNSFHPHVTISYSDTAIDPTTIEPFDGPLIFGPEIFAPVINDWDKKIKEISIEGSKDGVLENKTSKVINISKSIMENKRMNESLTSMLMKNIDLILEAYNVDDKGNLVVVNKKKVAESDDIFHQYFVKSMNSMFRQINENDPILDPMHGGDDTMHPPGDMHGMHAMGAMPHGLGMGGIGDEEDGMGGDMSMGGHQMGHMGHDPMNNDMQMSDMAMDDMRGGQMQHPMHPGFNPNHNPNQPMESTEGGEFDWVFDENTDLEIDSLFNLNEEDEEDKDEDDEDEDKHLNEFMDEEHADDHSDFLPDASMDAEGGHNDFGGDMGGMSDMGGGGMGGGMDDMGGGMDDGMGGDDDMMTIHGQTDNGGEFEFSFDKDALDFDGMDGSGMGDGGMGDDMGGDDDMGGHDMGGTGSSMSDEGGAPGFGHMGNEEGDGAGEDDENVREAAFHNGKPRTKKSGPKTSRMGIIPANPAAKRAVPFPTPMSQKQKR